MLIPDRRFLWFRNFLFQPKFANIYPDFGKAGTGLVFGGGFETPESLVEYTAYDATILGPENPRTILTQDSFTREVYGLFPCAFPSREQYESGSAGLLYRFNAGFYGFSSLVQQSYTPEDGWTDPEYDPQGRRWARVESTPSGVISEFEVYKGGGGFYTTRIVTHPPTGEDNLPPSAVLKSITRTFTTETTVYEYEEEGSTLEYVRTTTYSEEVTFDTLASAITSALADPTATGMGLGPSSSFPSVSSYRPSSSAIPREFTYYLMGAFKVKFQNNTSTTRYKYKYRTNRFKAPGSARSPDRGEHTSLLIKEFKEELSNPIAHPICDNHGRFGQNDLRFDDIDWCACAIPNTFPRSANYENLESSFVFNLVRSSTVEIVEGNPEWGGLGGPVGTQFKIQVLMSDVSNLSVRINYIKYVQDGDPENVFVTYPVNTATRSTANITFDQTHVETGESIIINGNGVEILKEGEPLEDAQWRMFFKQRIRDRVIGFLKHEATPEEFETARYARNTITETGELNMTGDVVNSPSQYEGVLQDVTGESLVVAIDDWDLDKQMKKPREFITRTANVGGISWTPVRFIGSGSHMGTITYTDTTATSSAEIPVYSKAFPPGNILHGNVGPSSMYQMEFVSASEINEVIIDPSSAMDDWVIVGLPPPGFIDFLFVEVQEVCPGD